MKKKLDAALERHYSLGKEKDRLNDAPLEKDRTLRILKREMPPSPAVVLDIGGANGVYSFPLAQKGYEVHLIDSIPIHIEQAKEYAKNFSSVQLASYSIGDARKIKRENNSADVILLFGPLYHLVLAKDRLKALREAHRVLKKEGSLFITAISRFQSFIDKMHKRTIYSHTDLVKQDLLTGLHPSESCNMDIYFHYPQELKEELRESGFNNVSLIGIEGPVWHRDLIQTLRQNSEGWEQLLDLLELIEEEETILGSSAHMMAIARK